MSLLDLISKSTTVTSANGTTTITVANATSLAITDEVIIESDHGYNEVGLGGYFDWDVPSGYYFGSGITVGKSLYATVMGVSGNDLTLDVTVPVEAIGLTLYRDNKEAIEAKIEAGTSWDAYANQTFHVGNRLLPTLDQMSEQTIDFKNAEFKSPRGCYCAAIQWLANSGNINNKVFKNLRLTGNFGDSGYGPTTGATEYQELAKSVYLVGRNCVIENFTVTDCWMAFLMDFCEDCVIQNSFVVRTQPMRQYIQWDALLASSSRCVYYNMDYDGDYPAPFCEAFKSSGIVFQNCTSRNGIFSINTGGKIRYIDCHAVWDWVSDGSSNVMTVTTSYWPVTRIIEGTDPGPHPASAGGTLILDCSVHITAITFPPSRVCYCHSTQEGTKGILTEARIFNDTYINDFPSSDTNSPNPGYWVYGDANDESLDVGGVNSVTALIGVSQNAYTRYIGGVFTIMPIPGEG